MAQQDASSRNGGVGALHPAGHRLRIHATRQAVPYFSYATILAILVFGVLSSLQIGQMVASKPTPWLGIVERGNVYAIMLWIAVLAIGLLRAQQAR